MCRSLKHATSRHLALLGIIVLSTLIALQVYLYIQQKQQVVESRQWVEHSYLEIREIESLLTKMKDAELGQRGFLLTGDERYLDIYYAVTGEKDLDYPVGTGNFDSDTISVVMRKIQVLTQDDIRQVNTMQQLNLLVHAKLDFIRMTIDLRRSQGERAAINRVRSGEGKMLMDNIRLAIADMIALEQAQLNDRLIRDQETDNRLTCYILMAAIFSYASLLVTILLIIRFFARARRIEQKLQAKEMHFRAAADGSMDGFFLFHAVRDHTGQAIDLILDYLNPVAERMIQKNLADVYNQSIEVILSAESENSSNFSVYRHVLDSQKAMEREYTVGAGVLKGRVLQKQAIPLPNGVAITCRDVTERHQIEQMKNEFVSTVSHELRTPLTSIRGSLGLVTGGIAGPIPDQAKGLLTIAYNNCERLVRLINDILDIEKIESGRMMFDVKAIAIMPLLQQAIKVNQPFAEKYGINLLWAEDPVYLPPDNTAKVLADSDRVIQVLTNLLSNAIKFSPEHSAVQVGCRLLPDHVRVDIIDHGPGIDANFKSQIFQKFAQADSSDTRQKNGTGLGLAITKALVEQMGGQVGFESKPGEGTVFYFTMPRVPADDHIIHLERPSHTEQQRILVCEDEHDIANLLLLIFEKAGFTVDIAYTAQQAFALLEKYTYAAMTLDLVLPDRENSTFRDGLLFIQKLRGNERYRDLPIIVVSAKAEEGQTLNGDTFGILDWLAKPIKIDRLVDIVRNLPSGSRRPYILHVEDDDDIAEVLCLTLAPYADIIRAVTVEQARHFLATQAFDLAILDVGLPDGLGTELLPLMKQPDGTAVPVILFTASDVTQDISAAVSATLIKSRTSEEALLDTIRHMIAQR